MHVSLPECRLRREATAWCARRVTRPVGHPAPAEARPRPSSSLTSEWGRKGDAARSASWCARCPNVTSSGIPRRRRFESERGGRGSCPSWSRRSPPDRPEGLSPGPRSNSCAPPHGIAPAPELADIPIGILSCPHWWRDADRRNFNSCARRLIFKRRVSGPPRSAAAPWMARPTSRLAVLAHVPLDRIDDAQKRQSHRSEMASAVHDPAKRRAPVHELIVMCARRMSFTSRTDIVGPRRPPCPLYGLGTEMRASRSERGDPAAVISRCLRSMSLRVGAIIHSPTSPKARPTR